jgi:hypothetical protein
MKRSVTLKRFQNALIKKGLKYELIHLTNNHQLLVTERWGKIFGPFEDENEPGTLWTSNKVLNSTHFDEMIRNDEWCIGGDRIWLAPEVQYNIVDRFSKNNENGYSLPKQIDPGNYRIRRLKKDTVELEQEMDLLLYNTASGSKKLHMKRVVKPANDPLRHLDVNGELSQGIVFTGYSQEVALTDLTPDRALTEAWNLIQLNPGGVVIIPTAGKAEYQDYYNPIESQFLQIEDGACFLKFTGKNKYKVGLKSANLFGRIGYFEKLANNHARLIVRAFFNNPGFEFIDEPISKPGAQGDAVQFYNDDGGLGGFGEIEVHGSAVGEATGRISSKDIFEFWQFTGESARIWIIADKLLGINKSEL